MNVAIPPRFPSDDGACLLPWALQQGLPSLTDPQMTANSLTGTSFLGGGELQFGSEQSHEFPENLGDGVAVGLEKLCQNCKRHWQGSLVVQMG